MMKIKKDDEVIVVAGKHKGRRGKVLALVNNGEKILVEGVTCKKTERPNPQLNKAGGIVDINMPLHISNVAIFNHKTNKRDKVGFKLEDGKKVRIYKSTQEVIGA